MRGQPTINSQEAHSVTNHVSSRRRFLQSAVAAGILGVRNVSQSGAAPRSTGGGTGDKTFRATSAKLASSSPEVPVTGIEHPQLAGFDRLMQDFVSKQQVVGAALAVTKDGRLVYARGFGLGDREAREPVQPDSLFRIASISKSLTGAAIVQLAEHERLKLDTHVVPFLRLPPTKDKRWEQITVRHLLHHTGGWDREKSFDPMFRSIKIANTLDAKPPAMPEQIIQYMTQEPLDFDPGQRFAYSNFGYCLLGRVIERASGEQYGDYVRRHVLAPVGVRSMRLGATAIEKRAPHEVLYYDAKNRTGAAVIGQQFGKQVPLPYGAWCLEAMDAHGGWIASAPDLARFAAALDDPARCPILRPNNVHALFARVDGPSGFDEDGKPKAAYYACGWNVRQAGPNGAQSTYHSGALDGTSTLLVRRHDRVNWAVLFNCRQGPDGKELSRTIDGLLHKAANEVSEWPDVDHFETS